jgi:hypothetical protein
MTESEKSLSSVFKLTIVFTGVGIGIIIIGSYVYKYLFIDRTNKLVSGSDIEISYCDKTPLTESKAIKLLSWFDNRIEEHIEEKKKESEALRLIHINNMERYKRICLELELVKENSRLIVDDEIKIKFGVSKDEIMDTLKPVCPILLEKKLLKSLRRKFAGQTPDKEYVYNAFGVYLNRTLEELQKLSFKYKDVNEIEDLEPREEDLIVMKYRINDEILQKFNLDENKLKYLFFNYELDNIPEMNEKLKEISNYGLNN